jgi:hypothetical protein
MRQKNRTRICFFGFMCLVLLPISAALSYPRASEFQPENTCEESLFDVSVDPRLELISIIQYLSIYRAHRFRLVTDLKFEYRRRVDVYFADYKNHAAVKLVEEASPKGFIGSLPPDMMIRLSDPSELKILHPLAGYHDEAFGGEEKRRVFLDQLRDFARESRFMDFFRQNHDQYEKMVQDYQQKMGNRNYVTILKDYTSITPGRCHIILVPLYGPAGFGPHLESRDGSVEAFNITGPRSVEDDIPRFGTEEGIRDLLLHEFGHSINNPLVKKYESEFNKYDSLHEPIKQKAELLGYGNKWINCVYEQINSAFNIRVLYRQIDAKEGEKELKSEMKKGWAYIPAICERLKEYEANRAKYKTYTDFFPRIIDLFKELSERELNDEFYFIPFDGTISSVRGNLKGLVIIVPTYENDPDVQERIREYAEKTRDERHTRSSILTDDEALATDLSQKSLVVFGTKDGNSFLKRYMGDHPVQIKTDGITADKDYAGTNLRFITAWPNPQNIKKGMVVYTAQRAEDIVGIRDVYAWDEDYVVARGTEVLKSGFYNLKDWDDQADYPVVYSNKEESMNRGSSQNDENAEWAAMKKLDFVIGKWEGEGWLLIGPEQRYPFSVTEFYSYRCNGLVVDGEGRFRPQGVPAVSETDTMYGLGIIYFDRQSGEYRMWHYGGTGSGFVFMQKIEIDVERRALHYINKDARGETYKFGFAIDDEGILTARSERQKPDGTWYVSMEFRMRRIK